jgi:hypothetical protein
VSNPSNRPAAIALYFLTGAGTAGLLTVIQVVYFGFRHPVNPALLDLVTVFSVLALLAGLGGIVGVSRETKAWEADPARMGPVLARWTYARDEWEAYTEREYHARRRGAWGFGAYTAASGGVAAVALGTLAMAVLGAQAMTWPAVIGWIAAAAAAVTFAGGVALWWGGAARTRRRNLALREPSVVIASRGVLVGDRRDYVSDRHTRTSSVRYVGGETPPVLEITVVYPGGRVKQRYTTRVAVPHGREDEARELAERFAAGRWEEQG